MAKHTRSLSQRKAHRASEKGKKVIQPNRSPERLLAGHSMHEDGSVMVLSIVRIVVVVTATSIPVFHLFHHNRGTSSLDLKEQRGKQLQPDSLAGSLLNEYAMDYHLRFQEHENKMNKYVYNYSKYGVDKRAGLSMEEFWDVYDGKWPVIITDVVPTWPAFNWSKDFLFKNYGKEQVSVKVVDQDLDEIISDVLHPLTGMFDHGKADGTHSSLDSAVSLTVPLELFPHNSHQAQPNRWFYVEDELFLTMRPQLKRDIGDCIYMAEDYFKLFPEDVKPWNAMLLWGTKYSRSSLHIDPYNWTGTNAVIKGFKRWKLYPPGQDHLLSVLPDRMSGFPLNCYKYNSDIDAFQPDIERYPDFHKAHAIEIDQFSGEMLFIPPGWFHQAFNMEETLAISSQLMNRNNYRIILEEILKVGTISRQAIPTDVEKMTPAKQVETIMKLLPPNLLHYGRWLTKNIVQHTQKKQPLKQYSPTNP